MFTFGVELECVLIYPREYASGEIRKGDHNRQRVIHGIHLVHTVLAKPFVAECPRQDCKVKHKYNFPLHNSALSKNDYSGWQVTDDVSVGLDEDYKLPFNLRTVGIEIVSRVLNVHTPTPDPNGQTDHHGGTMAFPWQWEVFHLLCVLNAHFSTTRNQRLFVNSSCGLHVHIGNGTDKKGFPAKTARSMMALFTAFERQLDSIISTPRIGGCNRSSFVYRMPIPKYGGPRQYEYKSTAEFNTVNETDGGHCRPMSGLHLEFAAGEIDPKARQTTIFSHTPKFPDDAKRADPQLALSMSKNNPLSWLYTVMSTIKIQDITEYAETPARQGGGHSSSINFENLNDTPLEKEAKQTIEIRLHDPSLDAAEICAWVDVAHHMVEFCTSTGDSQLAKIMVSNMANADFSFLDLAKILKVSQRTQDHFQKVLGDDYAIKRWAKIRKQELKRTDDVSVAEAVAKTQQDRLVFKTQSCVYEKIRHKFEDGLYGLMSREVGRRVMGARADEEAANPLFTARDDWFGVPDTSNSNSSSAGSSESDESMKKCKTS